MVLSYTLRVFCIVVVSLGGLMTLAELILWTAAPFLLDAFDPFSARQRERMLYVLQLTPALFALLGTACWSLPQYLRNETNASPEGVGPLCLLLTGMTCCWFAWSLLRGADALVQTVRFRITCKRCGTAQPWRYNGTAVVTLPTAGHRVALVGLLRPFILLSRDWLDSSLLAPEALEMVLAHEHAHAAHFDNWKLLSLRLLPSMKLPLRGGRTWRQLWQSSAEWAADDDASQDDGHRALLLAEALVLASRATVLPSAVLQIFLACDEADLAARVRRLIHLRARPASQKRYTTLLGLITAALGVSAVLASLLWLVPSLRTLPEYFLHLG